MFFSKLITILAFKYAHWALVYLFFAKILQTSIWPLFVILFVFDKLIRLVVSLVILKPEGCGSLLVFVAVVLQLEEFFQLISQNNDVQDAFKSEIINIPMIMEIIFVMLWTFICRDETAFYIQIPIMIIISFYLNYLWAKMIRQQNYEFYQFLPLYIEYIAYFGLIYIAIGIKYFFLCFIPFQVIILIIICFRFSKSIFFQQGDPIVNGFLFIFLSVAIFTHCGLDNRNSNSWQEFNSLKKISQRTQNYYLVCKLISLLVILITVSLTQFDYITLKREGISDTLMLVVFIFCAISFLIYIIQIFFYIALPSFIGTWYIEIEGLEELRKQNELHRKKQLNLEHISYVTINPYYGFLTTDQKKSKEFLYALLFNFDGHTLSIHNIGKRDHSNGKMKVTFYTSFYFQDLRNYLLKYSILENISEIELRYSFTKYPKSLFELINIFYRPINPILIKAIDMPLLLLSYQQQIIAFLEHSFINIVFFDKHLSGLMSVNPKQVLYDLYDM
ncbi:transmembrane protein, putative (macronuclear) [Tetrahymena thermophila SB210]|uniref:Transmembrane protein, putative n=1 Tax=Tetrahymena thermophila (strain SB210) TaxID=312017 RepID=W7WZE4_TETTS|nr:transmembrane protein, putative [Tetrahymena thermophila SB210]EWS72270.1 transmembrane protein, putative [Tetrahymena thermophila SB210]|eukprot:XP_012655210.1 transmembrane protein, putative [Tetrahymena thermophila SB210]